MRRPDHKLNVSLASLARHDLLAETIFEESDEEDELLERKASTRSDSDAFIRSFVSFIYFLQLNLLFI